MKENSEYEETRVYDLPAWWRKRGETEWHKETYRAFEVDEKLVFSGHMHSGSRPRASVKIALDLSNGLTTCILSKMGTEYYGNEISYQTMFGAAEIQGVQAPKYFGPKVKIQRTWDDHRDWELAGSLRMWRIC